MSSHEEETSLVGTGRKAGTAVGRGRGDSPDRTSRRRSRSPERDDVVSTTSGQRGSGMGNEKGATPNEELSEVRPNEYEAWRRRQHDQEYATSLQTGPLSYDEEESWDKVWDDYKGMHFWRNPATQAMTYVDPHPEAKNARIEAAKQAPVESVAGSYNPKIHGNYADWLKTQPALPDDDDLDLKPRPAAVPDYTSTATFGRFNSTFSNTAVHPNRTPDAHTDAAKSYRQMNAHFDVQATEQAQAGKSGKEERRNQKLTKAQLAEVKKKQADKKKRNLRTFLTKD